MSEERQSVGALERERVKTPELNSIEVKIHIRIENGHRITLANCDRIRLVETKPGRRQWHDPHDWQAKLLRSLGHDPATYQPTYGVRRCGKKFCFWEVNLGHGACGWQSSIRNLVIASSYSLFGPSSYKIFVDEKPLVFSELAERTFGESRDWEKKREKEAA